MIYYNQDSFRLYKGDSLVILNNLPENSVDMIFADPPYNLSNNGITCHAGKMVSVNKGKWDESKGFDQDVIFHEQWIKECKRILKPEGTIWISGTLHSIYQCGYLLQKLNFHILNDIAWFKPNAAPNLSCTVFAHSHETLLWAKKDKKTKHTFNYELMKNSIWKNDFIKKSGKQMRSVWTIPTPKEIEKKFGKHPTQKPEELLKRIILSSTKKGDLVLDPFSGSATTGIISYLYGREYIGIEKEIDYLDRSIKRFEFLKSNIEKKHSQQEIFDRVFESRE